MSTQEVQPREKVAKILTSFPSFDRILYDYVPGVPGDWREAQLSLWVERVDEALLFQNLQGSREPIEQNKRHGYAVDTMLVVDQDDLLIGHHTWTEHDRTLVRDVLMASPSIDIKRVQYIALVHSIKWRKKVDWKAQLSFWKEYGGSTVDCRIYRAPRDGLAGVVERANAREHVRVNLNMQRDDGNSRRRPPRQLDSLHDLLSRPTYASLAGPLHALEAEASRIANHLYDVFGDRFGERTMAGTYKGVTVTTIGPERTLRTLHRGFDHPWDISIKLGDSELLFFCVNPPRGPGYEYTLLKMDATTATAEHMVATILEAAQQEGLKFLHPID